MRTFFSSWGYADVAKANQRPNNNVKPLTKPLITVCCFSSTIDTIDHGVFFYLAHDAVVNHVVDCVASLVSFWPKSRSQTLANTLAEDLFDEPLARQFIDQAVIDYLRC